MIYLINNHWGAQFIEAANSEDARVEIIRQPSDLISVSLNDYESEYVNAALSQFEFFTVFDGDDSDLLVGVSDLDKEMRLKKSMCIVELMLRVAEHVVLKYGYVPKRDADQDTQCTESIIKLCHSNIKNESLSGCPFFGLSDLGALEGKKDNYLQRTAMWLLDMLEKKGGVSDFTREARLTIHYGYFNPRVIAWFANHIITEKKKNRNMKLPSKRMIQNPSSSMVDFDGSFNVSRVVYHQGFYGKNCYVIAAHKKTGGGVHFDMNFYKAKNMNIKPGDRIMLRGKPQEKREGEKYLKIAYAQVKI